MEARPLLNVPVLKNLRELRPYHTQDQISLPSVTRLTISVLRICTPVQTCVKVMQLKPLISVALTVK